MTYISPTVRKRRNKGNVQIDANNLEWIKGKGYIVESYLCYSIVRTFIPCYEYNYDNKNINFELAHINIILYLQPSPASMWVHTVYEPDTNPSVNICHPWSTKPTSWSVYWVDVLKKEGNFWRLTANSLFMKNVH